MDKKIRKRKIIFLVIFTILIIILSLFLNYQNKHLTVSEYIFKSPEITGDLKDYTIVQISDLHNARFGKNNSRLLDTIKKQNPDIIVITGDIVDSNHSNLKTSIDFAKEASGICPVYYVTGNHEYWLSDSNYSQLMTGLSEAGVVILKDDMEEIKVGESSYTLIGIDDRSLTSNKFEALAGDGLNVVLMHEPQVYYAYKNSDADLILTGHAHGGQFRLPFAGALYAPDQGFFPEYTEGAHHDGNPEMIISRGLGNSIIPFRLFNYPEIVVVEFSGE